jgi:hypothetical protein
MSSIRLCLILFAVLFYVTGCDGNGSSNVDAPQSVTKGYVSSSTIWSSRYIDVCWDMTADEFSNSAKERQTVRESIAATWEAASLVRFGDWGMCGANSSQRVRISVIDTGPYTTNLGNKLNNRKGGVVLNFVFRNWNSYVGSRGTTLCSSSDSARSQCIAITAVHEFGHVLGFAHEQNRPDTPSTCQEPAQGAPADTTIGAWDLQSIMNYCGPIWTGNGELSATDIAMVRTYYGNPDEPAFADSGEVSPIYSIILDD